jgi:hypothetical protein
MRRCPAMPYQASVAPVFHAMVATRSPSLMRRDRVVADFGARSRKCIGAMNGTFDRPRDDLLRAVIPRRVFDNPVTKQRPVLHQSEHTHVPPDGYFLTHDLPKCERFGVKIMELT